MKTIIAGGRNYQLTASDFNKIEEIHKKYGITEVVSGEAAGVDSCGETFAHLHRIPIKPFRAYWSDVTLQPCVIGYRSDGTKYNKLAGLNRNTKMVEYADALIVFRGGHGTQDTYSKALKKGITIFDLRRG